MVRSVQYCKISLLLVLYFLVVLEVCTLPARAPAGVGMECLHRLGTSTCLSEQMRCRQGDKEEMAKERELK